MTKLLRSTGASGITIEVEVEDESGHTITTHRMSTDGDRFVHLAVPATVLDDLVDAVIEDAEDHHDVTGFLAAGDDVAEWTVRAPVGAEKVALHVEVDSDGDPMTATHVALRVLTMLANLTSPEVAHDAARSLSVSTLVWSQEVPLLP